MRDVLSRILGVLVRVWFPVALVVLLLLALPAVVLFVLSLSSGEAEVNDWLQDNFQLSFHFPLPWWVGLLLLLVPPLLVLLYFLKLKRKPLQVPSTFLWRKSIEDLHVNSLFQWLRHNILLLLQLLAILVLIYAVLNLRVHSNTSRGKYYILMIDNSASMSATDVAPSRLEWAKEEATKEIDAASDEDTGMVIVFNSKATTLQTYTNNRAKLREAVRAIRPTERPTRIEEALTLADSLANPLRSAEDVAARPENEVPGKERTYERPRGVATEVFLFSDGRFPDLSESVLGNLNSRRAGNTSPLGNLSLHFRSAGRPGAGNVNNVGIVVLNAVKEPDAPGRRADPDLVRLKVLVGLRNYRPVKADVKLCLDVEVDGKIAHPEQKLLEVEPRHLAKNQDGNEQLVEGEQHVHFTLPPLSIRGNTVLHVYLKGLKDDFPADDQAWLVGGRTRKARVLIVGPGNEVLKAFFDQEATQKLAVVERLSPEDLTKGTYRKAAAGEFDLVIFDRCAPEKIEELPQSNTFFIDQVPPPWQRGGKELKNPLLMVSRKDHPLLRGLTTLWDVGASEAFRFSLYDNLPADVRSQYRKDPADKDKKLLPPLTRLIESGGDVPVLFTLPRGPYQDLVLTFPLINERGDLTTNWPLQPSFPLFLRNVLYALGNVSDLTREETVQPGEPMVLRPEAGVQWLKVTPPQGAAVTLRRGPRPEFTFNDTDHLGVYQVLRDDGGERGFAVNLLDGNESNIEPREEIQVGTETLVSGRERPQPHEIWKWVVLLALGLLVVEWYIYNRRIYV